MFRRLMISAALICASPAVADDMPMPHKMTGMDMSAHDTPSTKEFKAVDAKMHKGMMIEYTGKADVDFVKGMIAHHQGAIDMAAVELKYGSDPEMKALAEEIIKAQKPEIERMQAWLAKHPN